MYAYAYWRRSDQIPRPYCLFSVVRLVCSVFNIPYSMLRYSYERDHIIYFMLVLCNVTSHHKHGTNDHRELPMPTESHYGHLVVYELRIKVLTWKKRKVVTFTLRKSPVITAYIDSHQLERCAQNSDLGVMLDEKLTFAQHVDEVVRKANRMLGLLIRSMQAASCMRGARFDHRPVLTAFGAHVRSVIDYDSVIWSSAAGTHMGRLERPNHRFLMWLAARTQERCPSLDYDSLLGHFKYQSIKGRMIQTDIAFMRSVFGDRIDCSELVAKFDLATQVRRSPVRAIWARVIWAKVIWANYFQRMSLQRYDFWAIIEYSDFQCERKPCFSETNFSDHNMSDCAVAPERNTLSSFTVYLARNAKLTCLLPKSRIISRWGSWMKAQQWNLRITKFQI